MNVVQSIIKTINHELSRLFRLQLLLIYVDMYFSFENFCDPEQVEKDFFDFSLYIINQGWVGYKYLR